MYSLLLASSIGSAFAATAREAEIIIVCNLVNRLNSRHSIRILSTALHQHWLLEKGSRTMECSLIIFDSGMSLQKLLKRGLGLLLLYASSMENGVANLPRCWWMKRNAIWSQYSYQIGSLVDSWWYSYIVFLVQIHYYQKRAQQPDFAHMHVRCAS